MLLGTLSSDLLRATMVNMSIHPLLAAECRKVACPLPITKGSGLPQEDNILLTNTCRRDGASILTLADPCHLEWNLAGACHPKRQVPGIRGIGRTRYHLVPP